MNKLRSQLKTIGTIVTIIGATVVVLYKGSVVLNPHSSSSMPSSSSALLASTDTSRSDWIIGDMLLAAGYLLVAVCYIFTAKAVKEYPRELVVVLLIHLFLCAVAIPVMLHLLLCLYIFILMLYYYRMFVVSIGTENPDLDTADDDVHPKNMLSDQECSLENRSTKQGEEHYVELRGFSVELSDHEEDKVPDTPTTDDSTQNISKKSMYPEKKDSGSEDSLEGSLVSELDCGGDGI